MTDFFSAFDVERRHFTFVDATDQTLPVQQVGIVAVFHIVHAYFPIRRRGIARAFSLYHELYGDKLKGGYRGDKRMVVRPFSKMAYEAYRDYIVQTSPMNVVEFKCMSRLSLKHVSDYAFSVFSPAGWYENVHKSFTTVRMYLPVEELLGEGKARFERFLLQCCTLLQPIHGAAGLGIQQCHDSDAYQAVEYETAWAYRGLDVSDATADRRWRAGYAHLNWYTFLNHRWVAVLGVPDEWQSKLDEPALTVLPYESGIAIRAGDWPVLGKAQEDARPELYVKVNDAIRALRAPDMGSLHNGSMIGEARFNPLTSNLWLRRFDTPEEIRDYIDQAGAINEDDRNCLRMVSGVPCPWPGIWICEADLSQGERIFMDHVLLPEVDGQEVTWRLIVAL